MKPLLVLLFFGFLIMIFIGGALGETDLTPDTPPAAGGANVSGALLPVVQGSGSGPCASPYTVRSGDTLSALARSCSLALADLLAANPQITNANLIIVGQKINIPLVAAPAVVNAAAPTAAPAVVEAAPPTATEVVVVAAPPAEKEPAPTSDAIFSAFETARAPKEGAQPAAPTATPRPTMVFTGLKPGSLVKVSVAGFPANVPIVFGIGQVGKAPFMIDESITNDQGVATVIVAVPADARNGQRWTVTITTTDSNPQISATAVPFVIGK